MNGLRKLMKQFLTQITIQNNGPKKLSEHLQTSDALWKLDTSVLKKTPKIIEVKVFLLFKKNCTFLVDVAVFKTL